MNKKIINAEQINIVGKDGIPRLSLFNEDHIPNVLFRGEEILKGHRQNDQIAGMLFFNPNGTEAGGLIYGNNTNANGEPTAGMSLTFDQFEQDQVLQFLQKMGTSSNTAFICMTVRLTKTSRNRTSS